MLREEPADDRCSLKLKSNAGENSAIVHIANGDDRGPAREQQIGLAQSGREHVRRNEVLVCGHGACARAPDRSFL